MYCVHLPPVLFRFAAYTNMLAVHHGYYYAYYVWSTDVLSSLEAFWTLLVPNLGFRPFHLSAFRNSVL